MGRKNNNMGGFTFAEICIVIVLFALLALVAIPRYARARAPHLASNSCINNLRILDGAKHSWALENQKQNSDTPADSDIQPYCGRGSAGELPCCPDDPKQMFASSYLLHAVGTNPTCKIRPSLHVLN
jgi:competence protein ComGC